MTQPSGAVEAVARAICVANGYDPDDEVLGGQATGFENFGPRWQANKRSEGQLGVTDYVELAEAATAAMPTPSDQEKGYKDAFYQLSDLMNIPAQPRPPRCVWEAEMLPRLRAALVPSDQEKRISELEEALRWYADQFCELGRYFEGCGKLPDDQCSGCKARAALCPERSPK